MYASFPLAPCWMPTVSHPSFCFRERERDATVDEAPDGVEYDIIGPRDIIFGAARDACGFYSSRDRERVRGLINLDMVLAGGAAGLGLARDVVVLLAADLVVGGQGVGVGAGVGTAGAGVDDSEDTGVDAAASGWVGFLALADEEDDDEDLRESDSTWCDANCPANMPCAGKKALGEGRTDRTR